MRQPDASGIFHLLAELPVQGFAQAAVAGHVGGRFDPVAGDVADDDRQTPVAELQEVVEGGEVKVVQVLSDLARQNLVDLLLGRARLRSVPD